VAEFLPLWLFAGVCVFLLFGYPVAFSLGGTALLFAAGGAMFGTFDAVFLEALPNRLFGIVRNETLIDLQIRPEVTPEKIALFTNISVGDAP